MTVKLPILLVLLLPAMLLFATSVMAFRGRADGPLNIIPGLGIVAAIILFMMFCILVTVA